MGEREIYIIRMPEILKYFLLDFNLLSNKVFINSFIEDLMDISRSMMYNTDGVIAVDEVIKDFKSINFNLTPEFIEYLNRIITDVCLELLQTLVVQNIHNRLFYVDVSNTKEIILFTYDGNIFTTKG